MLAKDDTLAYLCSLAAAMSMKVAASPNEIMEQVPNLPGHSIHANPAYLDLVYVLDMRSPQQVRTLQFKRTGS